MLILAGGVRIPAVGAGIVAKPSAQLPSGALGVVIRVYHRHGRTIVQLRPAALSQIFSALQISASGSLADATATSAQAASGATARAASLGPFDPHFSCSGSAPSPHVDVDLSSMRYAVDIKVPNYIQVFIGGQPKFSVGMQFPAAVSCSASLTANIPLGDTGLFLEIGPQFSIQASGVVGANFTWSPRITYAFFRSSNGAGDYDIHTLTSSQSVDFTGSAGITANLALKVGLSVFGRAGIEGTLGPSLGADIQSSGGQTCRVIEASADADLDAYAHVWFANWSFDLAHVTFWKHQFASHCSNTGGQFGGGTSPGSGSGTGPGTGGTGTGGSGPSGVVLAMISCRSTSFCAAVGSIGSTLSGFAWEGFTYDGSSWSAPAPLAFPSGWYIVESLSCASSSFCLVVGESGAALVYDGKSWNAAGFVGQSIPYSVSCASPSFCAAVGLFGEATLYNGASWSPATTLHSGYQIFSVSCPATSFCVAVDQSGSAFTYNGSSWSSPVSIDTPGSNFDMSVSCASRTLCVALDNIGNAMVFNGASWTAPQRIDGVPAYRGLSCAPASSFCAVVDANGNVVTYRAGSWSTPLPVDAGVPLLSVSCASASFCVAGDLHGRALTYDGSSWSAPTSGGG